MATTLNNITASTISANLFSANLLGLTPRQTEASTWAAEGKTDDEIGAIMSCTGRTAKKHVLDAMKSTNTHTRAQLVAKLFMARVFSAAVNLSLIICLSSGLVAGTTDNAMRTRTRTTTSVRTVRTGREYAA
ncbi:helix-turn-helix domain-containing protein [Neptuniibacter pectenicola]|uniref:helix-turn-helix domain-containing protein n=1 Tax=Neptuniibacter pectenicola TaxID=1806669 RepID=UPI000830BDDD|nr:helix-turn-helix transcriptional regulator [Neptuniibacter pectenicola]